MLAEKYGKISTYIMDVCAQSSTLLMKVLDDKYQLFQHFEGFRNYMLIGRGDFYAYIISKLEYVYVLALNINVEPTSRNNIQYPSRSMFHNLLLNHKLKSNF